MDKKTQTIKINRLPIELYKFIKLESIVQSGGEAKMLILDGLVSVNGEIEIKKGKKLYSKDIIEIKDNDVKFVIE